MKTQTFKAKDVKSAINLVNDEFVEKEIILSTKKTKVGMEQPYCPLINQVMDMLLFKLTLVVGVLTTLDL